MAQKVNKPKRKPGRPPKSKGGRPKVITDEVLQKLRDAFLMGCTDEEACLFAEIAPATLYNYQNENEGYLEQKRQWKNNPVLVARKTVFGELDTNGDMAFKYLERKKKDEFGPGQTIDHNVKISKVEVVLVKPGQNQKPYIGTLDEKLLATVGKDEGGLNDQ